MVQVVQTSDTRSVPSQSVAASDYGVGARDNPQIPPKHVYHSLSLGGYSAHDGRGSRQRLVFMSCTLEKALK